MPCTRVDFLYLRTAGDPEGGVRFARGHRCGASTPATLASAAPFLSRRPSCRPRAADPDLLLRAVLTGDVLYAALADMRAAGPAGHPDAGGADAARGADIRPPPCGRNRLAAVGSPLCVTSLNEGILDTLEREGYQIARIPLGEMLWVLWRDNGTAAPE